MAKVKDVLVVYHKSVPFPWTIRKIKKAGKNPVEFLLQMGADLRECEDINTETGKALMQLLRDLDLISKEI